MPEIVRAVIEGPVVPWPTSAAESSRLLSQPVTLAFGGVSYMLAPTDRIVALERWVGDGDPPPMVTVYAEDLREALAAIRTGRAHLAVGRLRAVLDA